MSMSRVYVPLCIDPLCKYPNAKSGVAIAMFLWFMRALSLHNPAAFPPSPSILAVLVLHCSENEQVRVSPHTQAGLPPSRLTPPVVSRASRYAISQSSAKSPSFASPFYRQAIFPSLQQEHSAPSSQHQRISFSAFAVETNTGLPWRL